ncbi:M81 family metallopeptidase, partial [Sulfitobacter sp. HI0021]
MARMREIVGPDTTIGLELDPHCHLTDQMLDNATAIICYKEYPHVDVVERAQELFTICADAAAGKTRPVMRDYDCRM